MSNLTFAQVNTRHNIARILSALATPKTYAELCAELHLTTRTLCRYLTHLRADSNRRVYIKRYALINSRHSPVFALGSKPDAIKPKQGERERNAKRRALVRASAELSDRARKYESARWFAKKAATRPNTWCSPVMGEAA